MDWGFGNTNKTAALIATLMIGIWALAYFRKWGFWPSLLTFIGLGMCLVHTASRGGLVSVCCGLTAILSCLPKPWPQLRIGAITLGVLFIIGTSVWLKTYTRYAEGVVQEDPSIANRLSLWRVSPRMMVDAPLGWGLGNSGKAYMQWYQPLDRHEKYRTLVNSHATWLVEFGWPMRFIYIWGWLAILAITFPTFERPWTAIPFGIWVAFFVGSFFSSVAESFWLWIVPICGLFAALCDRWHSARWPRISTWLPLTGVPILLLTALALTGSLSANPKIVASEKTITIGQGEPKVWLFVDPQIIGTDFGRLLRHDLPPYAVGFITSPHLSDSFKGDTLIIGGTPKTEELQKLDSLASHFHEFLFVNPGFYPQEIHIQHPIQIVAIFGEYTRSSSIRDWKAAYGGNVSVLAGVGDFIPNWPKYLLIDK